MTNFQKNLREQVHGENKQEAVSSSYISRNNVNKIQNKTVENMSSYLLPEWSPNPMFADNIQTLAEPPPLTKDYS